MVECKTLEVEVALRGDVLDWAFKTDLPVDTIIMVSCLRYYEDFNGQHIQWPIFEDRVLCQPITDHLTGAEGKIDLLPSEAEAIQAMLKNTGDDWRGIRSIVDDALHLRCHLVHYQKKRLGEFGENNRNLSGPDVYRSGEYLFVTKTVSLQFPSNEYLRTRRRPS
ncbi:MAG: hypothetical protein EOP84_04165 [Verrucomicrobiaceae bacterium]|nr:MAG: hypothetical protein EOP84_04165 [Verrucomicrobiaceae bacterium]